LWLAWKDRSALHDGSDFAGSRELRRMPQIGAVPSKSIRACRFGSLLNITMPMVDGADSLVGGRGRAQVVLLPAGRRS
jgi:hypothetical protein